MSGGRSLLTLQVGNVWFPEGGGGGLDRIVEHLVSDLPAVGVGVRGLVAGGADVRRQTGGRVRAFAAPDAPLPRRLLGARRAARAALAGGACDLVASHFSLYTAPLLDLLDGRPLVVHFHGPWAAESGAEGAGGLNRRLKQAVERLVYRRAARFIVLSDAFGAVLREQFEAPGEWIRVVPGGVDTARFATALSRQEARDRLGWPRERPLLLAVRRLARRMGLENLLTAMAALRRDVPDALLLLAGSGPLAGELQRQAVALGLAEHVRFLGFLADADLPLAYRAADLSVAPTVALEGFGLVAAESLAAGTPVLVTPVGGLPEVVRDLDPRLVLPGCDAGSLAAGLRAALGGGLPLPDAERCRRFARERYDRAVVAAATRAVYLEALGRDE